MVGLIDRYNNLESCIGSFMVLWEEAVVGRDVDVQEFEVPLFPSRSPQYDSYPGLVPSALSSVFADCG